MAKQTNKFKIYYNLRLNCNLSCLRPKGNTTIKRKAQSKINKN